MRTKKVFGKNLSNRRYGSDRITSLPIQYEEKEKCEHCNKTIYTKKEAQTVANYERAIRRTKTGEIRIYECPHGNGWHLTTRI